MTSVKPIMYEGIYRIHYTKSGNQTLNAYREGFDFENSESKVETFWGLKTHWWKQIYPRKMHEMIEEPFLQGLGVVQNIKTICTLATRHIFEEPSIAQYDAMHLSLYPDIKLKKKCNYFHIRFGNTISMDCGIEKLFKTLSKDLYIEIQQKIAKYKEGAFLERYARANQKNNEPNAQESCHAKIVFAQEFRNEIDEKIAELNHFIARRSELLEVQPIATIQRIGIDALRIHYKCQSPEIVLERLFREFSEMIVTASEESKFRLIADLFQVMELLHPFSDEENIISRVLLAQMLSAHGFNPVILDDFDISQYCTLDSLVSYLKNGMKEWQIEAQKV